MDAMTATLGQSTNSVPEPRAPGCVPPAHPARARTRARVRGAWRGPEQDPPWGRPAVLALLAGTAVLYLWNLSVSGWANSFYSAAVQAGTKNWEAFFYGSSDASNFITVDKPPAALWVMELSARIFGVNSFAVLAPQALEGVAAVALLYAAVRRTSGQAAGLIAGLVLAVTPVAALMFRYDNPDALLVLLMTAGAYCVVRALDQASSKWLALAGACVGGAFLGKALQAFLVLPAFALVYLVAAPAPLPRRIRQMLLATAAMVPAGGWWVAVVELVPAADRPYIGGSQDDDFLSLTFGYNGFGRLTGSETGSVGGNGGWGSTGWTRMFATGAGSQIAWLLPTALLLLAAGLWATRRAPRTDPQRAGLLLWGGWLLVTGAVFSYMAGIFHAYYTVALAPAIGAVVGIGAVLLWRRREAAAPAAALALSLAAGAVWAYILLDRAPGYLPWLRGAVIAAGPAAAAVLLFAGMIPRRLVGWAGAVGLTALLLGPGAYTLNTVAAAHTGAIPTAGPASAGGFPGRGAPGAFAGPGGRGNQGAQRPGRFGGPGGFGRPGNAPPTGALPGPNQGSARIGGGMNGLLGSSTVGADLAALLKQDAGRYAWVAAVTGSNNASGYQLATGDPVMAVGGFNGTDPAPTLARFEQYARDGEIHYYIAGSTGQGGTTTPATEIASWVAAHYTAETVDGVTVYDLTGTPASS